MALRWLVRTFRVMPLTDRMSSLNRFVPVSKSRMMRTFHLSPMSHRVISAGQSGIFIPLSFKGNYEIASLTGSITQQGENPYLHLHMVIGNPLVGERHGGHLNRAVISATAEIFITVIDGTAGRRMNESIGLNLIEFTQA